MSLFYGFLIALHLVLCLVLIVLVLLQNDKAGGIGAGLGGLGGNGGAFSSGGAASFITKLTTGVAISFMVLVFVMNIFQPSASTTQQSDSVLSKAAKSLTAVPTAPAGAANAPAAVPSAAPAPQAPVAPAK